MDPIPCLIYCYCIFTCMAFSLLHWLPSTFRTLRQVTGCCFSLVRLLLVPKSCLRITLYESSRKDDSRAITIIRVLVPSRPCRPLLDPEVHNHLQRRSPAHIGMRGRWRRRRKVIRWAIQDLVMPLYCTWFSPKSECSCQEY